jgi:competence protein ComEC
MRRFVIALIVLSLFATLAHAQFRSVRVQVLDRGQADGIVIRTPNSEWVVIDAGTNGRQSDYMEEMGIDTVALAVISHRHFDHHGGMDEVLRDHTVERLAAVMEDCPNRSSDDRWRDQVDDEVELIAQGTDVTIDGVTFEILPASPEAAECPDEENDNSLVVRMVFGEFSMLFTGDAEIDRLNFLANSHAAAIDADVLKASHHGSHNGRTDAFLEAVTPDRVVISAAANSTHGHPHAEAVDDYVEAAGFNRVYCTNRHGTVRIYGYPDGRVRANKQIQSTDACTFDGS